MSPEQLALVGENGVALAPVQETGVTQLLELALNKGVGVDVLERLMDLSERVETRNARKAFFDAVAAFQEECPEIRKAKTAKIVSDKGSYSYTYAPLEEITRTIRPLLKAYGLAYSWDVEQASDTTLSVVCVLRHIEGHSERASFPVPIDTRAKMSGAQQHGAALTYGRRQSLIAVLGLTTADEDTDAPRGREVTKTITTKQVRTLDDMIEAAGADKAAFLAWLGYESLADVLASDYRRAEKALEEKLRKAGAQ